jgi:hypothetical protein
MEMFWVESVAPLFLGFTVMLLQSEQGTYGVGD